MGEETQQGMLILLRYFKKKRCGILPPNARLVLTSNNIKKKPIWEVLDFKTQAKITLTDENSSENDPSYRAQMGVVRYMKKNKDLVVDQEQEVNFLNERWPKEIRVNTTSQKILNGVYRRTKCMGTVCFHALWRCVRKDKPDTYLLVRPNVARTGPDHYIISTSPRYEDVSSVLAVLDPTFSPEQIVKKQKILVKTTMQTWTQDDTIVFTAPPSRLVVSRPDSATTTTTTTTTTSKKKKKTQEDQTMCHVFHVKNVPDSTLNFISAPSLSAMRRERLERHVDEKEEEEEKKGQNILELRINEAGSTAAQTRHRFGASLTPDLLRFSASGGIESLKKWTDMPEKASDKSFWGESETIIPPRPQCEYTTKLCRVAKTNSKTNERRCVEVTKVQPVFDGVKMNDYERKLRAIPNAFSVNVDMKKKCVDVAVRPEVLAHRAASSLLRGRKDCGVRFFSSSSFYLLFIHPITHIPTYR